jgi:DNA-binding response OmpR family regulator
MTTWVDTRYTVRVLVPAPRAGSGGVGSLSKVLLLTSAREPPADILPSLGLLAHGVRVAPASVEQATTSPAPDAILVDARRDLVQARRVLLALRSAANSIPVIAIVSDGGWAAVSADWGVDDLLLHTAGPGEVEARLRLAIGRQTQSTTAQLPDEIRSGGLVVNESTYSARMHGRSLDLTFKEFELLKFLAQHPGRVFTRAQLLQEVWGYDYFGGTRTVDVHVRRLRAKLGPENEAMIGTVRNVGYRFVPVKGTALRPESAGAERAGLDSAGDDSADDDSAGAGSTANGADGPAGIRQSDPGAAATARPEHAYPQRATAHASR